MTGTRAKPIPRRGNPAEMWRKGLDVDGKSRTKATFANLALLLEHLYDGRISFDQMNHVAHLDGVPCTDHEFSVVRRRLGKDERVNFTNDDIARALSMVGREARSFHPVVDHLRALKWDGKSRLEAVGVEHFGVSPTDDLSMKMISRTLRAAVARALDPGCKVDTVLVLVGPQGGHKSSALRVLGGAYFGESNVDFLDRKGVITLASKWINELPEVDRVIAKRSSADLKAFLSQCEDSYVPPYGRNSETRRRSWILVGTSNKRQLLTDATGSRRWWIVDLYRNGPTWRLDLARWAAERDQILAEAVVGFDAFHEHRQGGVSNDENPHRWWFNDQEELQRVASAGEHAVEDLWAGPVATWLGGGRVTCRHCQGTRCEPPCGRCDGGTFVRSDLQRDQDGREYVTSTEVLTLALGIPLERVSHHQGKIAETLESLGWRRGERFRRDGHRITPYYSPAPNPDADEANAIRTGS